MDGDRPTQPAIRNC